MADIPNLAGIATADLVEKIGAGSFSASYINWSRTLHLLRTNAPGWLPELVPTRDGGILHEAPQGAFLLIRFRHTDGTVTPEVPQAIMDTRNAAIATAKVTARDITDTHRRGVCMAAALTFGLAYELWAKVALESGYGEQAEEAKPQGAAMPSRINPTGDAWEAQNEESQAFLLKIAAEVSTRVANDPADAHDYLAAQQLETDEKAALWTRLDSKTRTALKKAHDKANHKEAA
jgi:hypothetical protein